ELVFLTLRPVGRRQCDLAGHHLRPTPRRLVIEKNAAYSKHATRSIHFAKTVCGSLRDSVGRCRGERSLLVAQSIQISVHLGTGGLVDARIRLLPLDNV